MEQTIWNKSPVFTLGAQEEVGQDLATLFVVPAPQETTPSGVIHVGGAGGSACE